MMYEDKYLFAGWLWTIGGAIACFLAWVIAIVTIIRFAEGIQHWLTTWWPL